MSPEARDFLELIGPLDWHGWAQLADAPVGGWPAREIVEAMLDTDRLRTLIPLDIVGMLTDRNTDEVYR